MSEIGELSYSELRQKDIVSINDGRKLGKIVDLVFSPSGRVKGIVAPYGRRFLCFRNQFISIDQCSVPYIVNAIQIHGRSVRFVHLLVR